MLTSQFLLAFLLAMALLAPQRTSADSPPAFVNILPNPGAEQIEGEKPAGFGVCAGAGKMRLTASTDQPHNGQRAADHRQRLAVHGVSLR